MLGCNIGSTCCTFCNLDCGACSFVHMGRTLASLSSRRISVHSDVLFRSPCRVAMSMPRLSHGMWSQMICLRPRPPKLWCWSAKLAAAESLLSSCKLWPRKRWSWPWLWRIKEWATLPSVSEKIHRPLRSMSMWNCKDMGLRRMSMSMVFQRHRRQKMCCSHQPSTPWLIGEWLW